MKKAFSYVRDISRADELCPADCVVVPMQGYSRFEDFYLFVPAKGIFFRTANSSRYGSYMYEVFMDGSFVGACRIDKTSNIQRLYDAGYTDEAREYALEHRLWKETTLGGKKINKYKEAARYSHMVCDLPGKEGHNIRQAIRVSQLF